MPKDPSPLLGYNNNIRHKSRVFHVQTEDSGVRHPHIITHLFMDGGRILKSVKTSYAEHLGAEKMADVVRLMMKEQHKAMLMALRDGRYDELVDGGAAPAADAANRKAAAVAPTELALKAALPDASRPRAPSVRPPPVVTYQDAAEEGPATARNPSPPEELTLDIDALERAAEESSSPLFQQSDLPPPPANLFRERGGGGYSTVTGPTSDKAHPTGRPPTLPPQANKAPASTRPGRGGSSRPPPASQRKGGTPRPPASGRGSQKPGRPRSVPPPGSAPPSEGRYAAARPAAIFGHSKPPRGNSIFGEDLISDKSLDEVILSYLAEDLDPASEKKKR